MVLYQNQDQFRLGIPGRVKPFTSTRFTSFTGTTALQGT